MPRLQPSQCWPKTLIPLVPGRHYRLFLRTASTQRRWMSWGCLVNLGLLPVFIDAVGKKLDKISEMQDSSPLLFEATSVPKHISWKKSNIEWMSLPDDQEKLDGMGVDRADKYFGCTLAHCLQAILNQERTPELDLGLPRSCRISSQVSRLSMTSSYNINRMCAPSKFLQSWDLKHLVQLVQRKHTCCFWLADIAGKWRMSCLWPLSHAASLILLSTRWCHVGGG